MAPMTPDPAPMDSELAHAGFVPSASVASPAPQTHALAVAPIALASVLAPGPRLGFRPDELAALLGVSKDLVDSWLDSGKVPRARVPGKVRIIPAWWVAQALGDPTQAEPRAAERPRASAHAVSIPRPAPVVPPRLHAVPSPASPARKVRKREQKQSAPAAWAVPPTASR